MKQVPHQHRRAPARPPGDPFWSEQPETLMARLGSGTSGLTSARAADVLRSSGPNDMGQRRKSGGIRLLLRQFLSPIVLILAGATILSAFLGDVLDASIILGIIVASGLLGFWQERGAGRAMAALLETVQAEATLLRDGRPEDIPLVRVVPGDIVLLDAGDLVPGDCLLLESQALSVDESTLTGEPFPVEKTPGVVPPATEPPDRHNVLFLGTHVTSGAGTALVVSTGTATEMGALAAQLGADPVTTGFERGMTAFGLLLMRIMSVLVVIIFVANLLLQRPPIDAALFSLALAVGLTPQLLPAIVSISLARGARRMAQEKVIVRRLDAIEDFGSMSVFCSDKTGTMTRGTVELDRAIGVDGLPSAQVRFLAVLNAGLQRGFTNPLDEAILATGSVGGNASSVDEAPYDFDRRRLSVLVSSDDLPETLLITKGALEAVLSVCAGARAPDGTVTPLGGATDSIRESFERLSREGYRVLGLATKSMPSATAVSVLDERNLVFEGMLVFSDPVKDDAAETVRDLVASGVSVRMLTGDNHLVAAHVANAIGLATAGAMRGADVERCTEKTLAAAVGRVEVFAELNPVQKERVVAAFRASGATVGYFGDGINDSPALQAADVGISVDTAVPVAKESASIVLLEKDLRVLREGVRQGRQTFANTMKYVFLTTSANFGNMLSMAIAAFALPFLPLLASQILLINLLTDLPSTSIATDRVDARQLSSPQIWDVRLIRNYMLVFGSLSSVFDLATFAILRLGFAAEAGEFRSAWFLGSILTEICVLFVLRTRQPFYRSRPSAPLLLFSALVIVVTVAIPYTPLSVPLSLPVIPTELIGVLLVVTIGYVVATEVAKRFFWAREARPAVSGPMSSPG